MRTAALILALIGLAVCLLAPIAYFRGSVGEDAMKAIFLAASIVWFVSASVWSALRRWRRMP